MTLLTVIGSMLAKNGEQSENGELAFCLPYGLWLPSFSWLPNSRAQILDAWIPVPEPCRLNFKPKP